MVEATTANENKRGRKTGRNGAQAAREASGELSSDLDVHDEAIVACLREDGRMSNRELATKIGLNEATVRARIRRLEETDTMRVVAMIDLAAAGFKFMGAVGVQVKGRTGEEVGLQLSEIPQVLSVTATMGAEDIELQIVARSLDELNELLTKTIPGIPGVARIEPALALNIVKYESTWVPFL